VLLVIFLGAGCSALAFALSAFGARHLKAGQCSVILNVEVPIGVAAGAIVLQEPIAAGQILGGLLIVTGAVLIMTPARSNRRATTRSPVLAADGVERVVAAADVDHAAGNRRGRGDRVLGFEAP
jgi:hypothetical protein